MGTPCRRSSDSSCSADSNRTAGMPAASAPTTLACTQTREQPCGAALPAPVAEPASLLAFDPPCPVAPVPHPTPPCVTRLPVINKQQPVGGQPQVRHRGGKTLWRRLAQALRMAATVG